MKLRLLAPLAAAPLLLTACATDSTDPGANPEALTVVTSFYPLQYTAEQVGGDQVSVETLTQPGAEPHDLELTPQQVASITDADLVIYLAGLQPAVDEAIAEAQPAHVLEVGALVERIDGTEESAEHDHAEGEHAEGEHTESDHAEDEHDHGSLDPHIWLDPENMVAISDGVAAALTELQPDGGFDQRADTLDTTMQDLDQRFSEGLAECETRTFITSHAAFAYLAQRYDLEQISIRGISPDEEPSAARIAEVQELAKADNITTIFYETLVSPAVSEAVANDLGLVTDVLDPLEGLTDASRGTDYVSVMDSNLEALRTANRCQ